MKFTFQLLLVSWANVNYFTSNGQLNTYNMNPTHALSLSFSLCHSTFIRPHFNQHAVYSRMWFDPNLNFIAFSFMDSICFPHLAVNKIRLISKVLMFADTYVHCTLAKTNGLFVVVLSQKYQSHSQWNWAQNFYCWTSIHYAHTNGVRRRKRAPHEGYVDFDLTKNEIIKSPIVFITIFSPIYWFPCGIM